VLREVVGGRERLGAEGERRVRRAARGGGGRTPGKPENPPLVACRATRYTVAKEATIQDL
jgi:hypothetical protein